MFRAPGAAATAAAPPLFSSARLFFGDLKRRISQTLVKAAKPPFLFLFLLLQLPGLGYCACVDITVISGIVVSTALCYFSS